MAEDSAEPTGTGEPTQKWQRLFKASPVLANVIESLLIISLIAMSAAAFSDAHNWHTTEVMVPWESMRTNLASQISDQVTFIGSFIVLLGIAMGLAVTCSRIARRKQNLPGLKAPIGLLVIGIAWLFIGAFLEFRYISTELFYQLLLADIAVLLFSIRLMRTVRWRLRGSAVVGLLVAFGVAIAPLGYAPPSTVQAWFTGHQKDYQGLSTYALSASGYTFALDPELEGLSHQDHCERLARAASSLRSDPRFPVPETATSIDRFTSSVETIAKDCQPPDDLAADLSGVFGVGDTAAFEDALIPSWRIPFTNR